MELLISVCAASIALYAVITQRQELSAQREELRKSANANEEAQKALNIQTNLQALSSLLDAEIHLHNFNNDRQLDPDKQKKWASENFKEIKNLKKAIQEELTKKT